MNRLERNRREALAIVARIERNLELSSLIRQGQFIRQGQVDKRAFQQLLRNLQPKKEYPNEY